MRRARLISSDGCGSITTTRLASRPPASHPVSIAPPILPAPASAMVPLMFCKCVGRVQGRHHKYLSSSLRTQGPITTGGSSEARDRPQAVCLSREVTAYGFLRSQERQRVCGDGGEPYASPSVSNIAALMASAARFPGPDHELERGVIALAGVDGADQHGLALRGRGGQPARQHQRLPVHDHAGVGPDVEMADP